MDNQQIQQSIASVCDGLKPDSRKVLFTCLKRYDKRVVKVAQLAGSVAEHSAYHYGEQRLMSTIINLAQNFVGSNNINLLQPIGQFGTRRQGGKDAASPRNIFTMLSPLTRLIFHPHDDALLNYLNEDNHRIEPEWYLPIIPMVLVNGADGGGWMTKIPNHNPREIIDNIMRMLRGEEPLPMKPWYKNFKGEINYCGDSRFVLHGEIAILDDDKLEITELQIGKWTTDYRDTLDVLLHGQDKVPPVISDYKEYHTNTTVKFVVTMPADKLHKAEMEGLHKVFKLQTTMATTSMCALDRYGVLTKYDTTSQILREFYKLRLEYYGKRKDYMEGLLGAEVLKLTNQSRFIQEMCDDYLWIKKKIMEEIFKKLTKKAYDSDPVKPWKSALMERLQALAAAGDGDDEAEAQSQETENPDHGFDYLLYMPLRSLTIEGQTELNKKLEKMERQQALAAAGDGDEEAEAQSQETENPDQDLDYLLYMPLRSLTTEERRELKKKLEKMERQQALAAAGDGDDEAEAQSQETENPDQDFNYLLYMPVVSLTIEGRSELNKKLEDKITELNILKKKSPQDMWKYDLDELREKLDEVERKEREDESPLASLNDTMPSSPARRVEPKFEEFVEAAACA